MRRWALAALLLAGCGRSSELVVGSKPFTESEIVGEMVALLAESLGVPVRRRFLMGGMVCFQSLRSGDMDVYVEYTGTGLVSILQEPAMQGRERVYRRVEEEFRRRWGLLWGRPLGFNNTYALVMRPAAARRLKVRRLSDLRRLKGRLRCGWDLVFADRPDGYRGLRERGLGFCASEAQMDPGLLYGALAAGHVDVISGYATDGRVASLGLRVLEDDSAFFPPYDAAPLLAPSALRKAPGLREKLDALAGRLTDEKMTRLNALVDAEKRRARDVAREFLQAEGLL